MSLSKSDLGINKVAAATAIEAALLDVHSMLRVPKPVYVVVNLLEPSYRKRLYVVETKTSHILRAHHVAHGSGSSTPDNKTFATSFSNVPESHKSSLGAMITTDVYTGKHGRSLKLRGLDDKLNSNVESRNIVIHSANYVTDSYIMAKGRAGCSYGCFALDPAICDDLIDLIKNGTFLYSYGG